MTPKRKKSFRADIDSHVVAKYGKNCLWEVDKVVCPWSVL